MRLKVGLFLKPVYEPSKVVFDRKTGRLDTASAPRIMNPSDRSAIEVALNADAEIHAFCMGHDSEPVLREALAFGITNANLFEVEDADSPILHASLLAKAASEIGVHVMLFGHSTIDYGYPGTAEATASKMHASFIADISSLQFQNNKAVVTKIFGNKSFKTQAKLPCVLTVKAAMTRRYPKPANIREGYQKSIAKLGYEHAEGSPTLTIRRISPPEAKEGKVIVIKGEAKQVVSDAMRLLERIL